MKSLTEKLRHAVETLPPPLQQEVLHAMGFRELTMTHDPSRGKDRDKGQKGTTWARLMEEAINKNLFVAIKDPAAWQAEIRRGHRNGQSSLRECVVLSGSQGVSV